MRYVSKRKELCLVYKPQDRMLDEQRRVIIMQGKRAEFMGGRFQTNDPELIAWLSTHPKKNIEFMEVKDDEWQAIQKDLAKMDAKVVEEPTPEPVKEEAIYRPESTMAISPELVEFIDKRINDALGTILNILQPKAETTEVKQEEASPVVVEDKPKKKSFTCPYCKEVFPSGFEVGTHKKTCAKRPSNI